MIKSPRRVSIGSWPGIGGVPIASSRAMETSAEKSANVSHPRVSGDPKFVRWVTHWIPAFAGMTLEKMTFRNEVGSSHVSRDRVADGGLRDDTDLS